MGKTWRRKEKWSKFDDTVNHGYKDKKKKNGKQHPRKERNEVDWDNNTIHDWLNHVDGD